jgi:hypothetical protein
MEIIQLLSPKTGSYNLHYIKYSLDFLPTLTNSTLKNRSKSLPQKPKFFKELFAAEKAVATKAKKTYPPCLLLWEI